MRATIPATIFINGRFLTQATTGVQRYAIELVKAWDAMLVEGELDPKKIRIVLLVPGGVRSHLPLRHIEMRRIGHLHGQLWEQLELPMHAAGAFLVNLCNSAPLLKRRQSVTIHDASVFAVPQAYSWRFRSWYRFMHAMLARRAQLIFTDSLFSKAELTHFCGIDGHDLQAIHLSGGHIHDIAADTGIISRNGLDKVKFVLAVSSQSPHKNFNAIVNALPLMKSTFPVVIAGGANSRVFSQSPSSMPVELTRLGYVTDGELRALYEHAACFVYPSIYEGFGLPPLEAMCCGCPVIAANAASLPEVCADAALYCDPYDPADIAEKIDAVMDNPVLRGQLRTRGIARSDHFSWKACARATWAAIDPARLN